MVFSCHESPGWSGLPEGGEDRRDFSSGHGQTEVGVRRKRELGGRVVIELWKIRLQKASFFGFPTYQALPLGICFFYRPI